MNKRDEARMVSPDASDQLDAHDEDLYRRLVAREHVRPDDTAHLERLRSHHLIEDDPHSPGKPLVLDPRLAERRRVSEVHEEIIRVLEDLRDQATRYRRLESEYTSQRATEGGIRLLDGRDAANAAIGQSMAKLSTALYTAQPSKRSAEVIAASYQRDGDLLRRGIKMFTIYPLSARRRDLESQWATDMSALGAEIRTSPVPFPRIIVVAGVAAYIEDIREENSGQRAALEITHPAAMAWVRAIYMFFWNQAQPWTGARNVEDTTLTTQRQRAILRLLGAEQKRNRIARQLDVSERVITKELGVLRQKFSVETDFALALRWRDHPEYNLP